MDIILLERVGNLGKIGDVVTVKDGYARNFLLPNKKALRANEANKQVFEANRERLEQENEERRAEAAKEGGKLDGMTIELIRQASNTGQLYGSVAVRDIIIALDERGEKVTKRQVVLERPIKAIGLYEVTVNLHPEVDIIIKVNVARSPEEAERQAEGIDVIAEMFEKEQAEIASHVNPAAEPGEVAVTGEDGEEAEGGAAEATADGAAEAMDDAETTAEAEVSEDSEVQAEADASEDAPEKAEDGSDETAKADADEAAKE